ncbi:MAG: hypothetical protein IPK14_13630 [Blastocatellia bacterium]|nr:hypothetical protein [Blastocatellia bacterium]MBL8197273.1 hypothetical protein [Blastocatellia bacterium]
MKILSQILYLKSLETLRQIKDNLFSFLVLAPMVLAVVYLLAVPYLNTLAIGAYPELSLNTLQLLTTVIIFLLILSSISKVITELYPLQSADAYLDGLPIPVNERFFSILIIRMAKNLLLLVILGVINFLISKISGKPLQLLVITFFLLIPIGLQLTVLQLFLVIFTAHFKQLNLVRILIFFTTLFLIQYFFPAIGYWLNCYLLGIRELLILLYYKWIGSETSYLITINSLLSIVVSLLISIITFIGYRKWAIQDREVVEQLLSKKRRFSDFISQNFILAKAFGLKISAYLLRDLILTFRFFSAAVYLSFSFAIIFQISLILLAKRTDYPVEIIAQVVVSLSSFALAALAPALVKHQLPFLWLERSLPVAGQDMYWSKVIYAGLVSLPPTFISFLISLTLKSFDLEAGAFLFFQLMLLWLTVSSLVGVLCFEMAARPGLAIPFIAIASLAIAILVIQVWWIWFILYPYAMDKLQVRARERARVLIIGLEGDND